MDSMDLLEISLINILKKKTDKYINEAKKIIKAQLTSRSYHLDLSYGDCRTDLHNCKLDYKLRHFQINKFFISQSKNRIYSLKILHQVFNLEHKFKFRIGFTF